MSNRYLVALRTFVSVFLGAIVFSTLSFAVTADRIAGAISSGSGVTLQNSLNRQAQAKYDQGPVNPSLKLSHLTLVTTPSPAQEKALQELLVQQQDRSSRNYHKWLTPAQYGERFGLSANDMSRITAWLKSQGFTIMSIAGGRNQVSFSGTAAQVESAFKTEIHSYNVNGEQHFANATPLTVPSALNGIVTGVIGVHNFRMHALNQFHMSPGAMGSGPISSGFKMRANYYDANLGFNNFLGPGDVAVMYDINGLYNGSPAIDGTGETIAIVGQTDIFLEDINDFRSGFGLTPISASNCTLSASGIITKCNDPLFQYVLVGSDPGSPSSDDLPEADLDVEWSGAIAPGAQVFYINSPEGNGVIDSLNYALNPPSGTAIPATVVSMSYGLCEFNNGFNVDGVLQQGLSEGVTIMAASGDAGSASCDRTPPNDTPPYDGAVGGQGVSYPASSPYMVAVGGTAISIADDEDPNQYWNQSNTNMVSMNSANAPIPEIPWNDDEAFAQLCTSISDPSGNAFCNPSPGVLVTTAQTAQEDYWISAGGGGASNCFTGNSSNICTGGEPQPSYQSGLSLTVTNIPSPATRWVPDVSFLASPNFPGYIICTQLSELGLSGSGSSCNSSAGGSSNISSALELSEPPIFGGTSVASPVFAGMVALLNESLAGASSPGLGDIHPMLYQLAAANATTPNGVFNPVITGDNYVYCQGNTPTGQPASVLCPNTGANAGRIGFSATDYDSTTKYNLVAGLGSVNANALATAWSGTRATTSVTLTPSATQIALGTIVTLTAVVTPASATGNVTFTSGSTSLGTVALAQVSGAAQAQLATTALPIGSPDNVTATFNGNSGLGSSTSNTAQITVTSPFTLTSTATSYPVTPGQQAQVTVNIAPNPTTGFTGNVTFTCSDPAPESICTGPSGPVAVNNASTPANFTITTTAATTSSLRSPFDHRSGSRTFYALFLPGLLGIMLTFGSRKHGVAGMRMLGMILVLGLSTAWMSSCGGSSNNTQNNPGTPAGNYTITITATTSGSGTSFTAQPLQVTLAVQ